MVNQINKHTSMPLRAKTLLSFAVLGLVGLSSQAQAWWSNDWAYRKSITLDAQAAGVSNEQNTVPVLIRLHEGILKFTDVAPDGADIRFVADDDKTPLKFHIEKFDSVFNLGFVWVHVPKLAAGKPTSIWMYYGNQKATPENNSKDTYDANQVAVYHFAEKGTPVQDSSAFQHHATNFVATNESGLIGNAARFDGTASLSLPASITTTGGTGVTWSAWVKPVAPESSVIYAQAAANNLIVGLNNGAPYVSVNNVSTPLSAQIADNNWHHLALTSNAGQTTFYVDGQVRATLNQGINALQGLATVGGLGNQQLFHGEVDELKIAKVARDATAIQLEANNQGTNDKLVQFGGDEASSSSETGYFGAIMASLTFDGWVAIGFLMVMMVISWIVMAQKGRLIGRVSKANNFFLELFQSAKGDFAKLHAVTQASANPQEAHLNAQQFLLLSHSPLMRVFQRGINELHDRLQIDPRTGRPLAVLSEQSIEAIRATLNGALVRETQFLNKNLVLLTIAISGGPFIGLLGTVIGVMITFAAVAAAGDVNVNAIAPGISAALAATVAGLAVAIPALFGYNYLLTRVKENTVEMNVFIEDFIARMAENYNDPAALHAMSDD
ncbi:DUF2341 domain-containing protein [Agitococcus lubricus]|uniref:Outer membrane transport energization protein ExbB n=1 Tax=Agitococcus lubricus TaxID=1077255 RepID=A0A2T5IUA4_9GAMM|nr:MotA/TolQ/ExbB proton channel family protein [Agitococcus lubricus]PTQ87386.1 outer membrane transport energization protein ExbB [Agitococcus lubricus]